MRNFGAFWGNRRCSTPLNMLPLGLKCTFSFQVQLNADMNIELYAMYAVLACLECYQKFSLFLIFCSTIQCSWVQDKDTVKVKFC